MMCTLTCCFMRMACTSINGKVWITGSSPNFANYASPFFLALSLLSGETRFYHGEDLAEVACIFVVYGSIADATCEIFLLTEGSTLLLMHSL